MASQQPVILENISLDCLISHILDNHSQPSNLVICGTKEAFIAHLVANSPASSSPPPAGQADPDSLPAPAQEGRIEPWIVAPTLRLLSLSRTVRAVFCPDITHLSAYLATLAPPEVGEETSRGRLLAILNPVSLHRPTSAFSAQGLNRTFAAAVEAAYRSGSKLIVAECYDVPAAEAGGAMIDHNDDSAVQPAEVSSIWNEEISILNITTKSFGAGERGWVGRTARVRNVAARWCVFEELNDG